MLVPNRGSRWIPGSLLAVALLVSACAHEVSGAAQPSSELGGGCDAAVVLALDVSLSMDATDVAPSRLAAARQGGKSFAGKLSPDTLLGLVVYSGTASVLVSPTAKRDAFTAALDTVRLSERTATGEGIFTALSSIDAVATAGRPTRIVLVADGKQTVPASPDEPRGAYTAARAAGQKKVPISAISLGTPEGVVDVPDGGGGVRVAVPVDPPSLREIAKLSGGSYHAATNLDELNKAFEAVPCA